MLLLPATEIMCACKMARAARNAVELADRCCATKGSLSSGPTVTPGAAVGACQHALAANTILGIATLGNCPFTSISTNNTGALTQPDYCSLTYAVIAGGWTDSCVAQQQACRYALAGSPCKALPLSRPAAALDQKCLKEAPRRLHEQATSVGRAWKALLASLQWT